MTAAFDNIFCNRITTIKLIWRKALWTHQEEDYQLLFVYYIAVTSGDTQALQHGQLKPPACC